MDEGKHSHGLRVNEDHDLEMGSPGFGDRRRVGQHGKDVEVWNGTEWISETEMAAVEEGRTTARPPELETNIQQSSRHAMAPGLEEGPDAPEGEGELEGEDSQPAVPDDAEPIEEAPEPDPTEPPPEPPEDAVLAGILILRDRTLSDRDIEDIHDLLGLQIVLDPEYLEANRNAAMCWKPDEQSAPEGPAEDGHPEVYLDALVEVMEGRCSKEVRSLGAWAGFKEAVATAKAWVPRLLSYGE